MQGLIDEEGGKGDIDAGNNIKLYISWHKIRIFKKYQFRAEVIGILRIFQELTKMYCNLLGERLECM